jgi:hypothetical protein
MAELPPQCRPQLLTPDQERIVREALVAGSSRDEAAWLAGISRRRLDARLRDQLRDVRVGQGRGGGAKGRDPPSPEEIERMCELIRSRWTDSVRVQRRRNFTGQLPEG